MATNTNGGTTTSLDNAPQAKADTFYKDEDLSGIALLDVMLNDLAGNAKILWSVDDFATDAAGSTDLVSTDIGKIESTATDTSAHGAKIWIQDGKVAYQSNTLDAAFKASLQALAVGETTTDTFTYAIRMSNGTLSWNTATIVFTGTNDGPVAHADTNGADLVTEAGVNPGNTPNPGDPSATGNVLANDTDVDNLAVLSVKDVNGSAANVGNVVSGTYGSVTINANGSWTYNLDNGDSDTHELAQGQIVTETFTYTVTDQHGATSSSTLTITITGTNDLPVANADSGTTAENAAVLIDVLANDTDPDNGHTLTVTAASAPAGQGSASVVGNQVQFDPGTDFDHLDDTETAIVTISYTIADEHGATSTSTIEITVNGANDAPVSGGDDSASGSEDDASITGQVPVATDVDVEPLTYALVAGSVEIDGNPAPDGTVLFNSDGSYSYDPAGDQDLDDTETREITFRYVANDGSEDSAEAEVTITVNGANDAPVSGGDDSASGSEDDASITGQVPVATDVDVEPLTYALVAGSVEIDGNPAPDGTVLFNSDGSYSYDPAGDQDLDDTETREITFRYVANDGSEDSAEAEVTITVNGANDAPVSGGDDSASGSEDDASITGQVPVATDVDVEPLTYALVAGSVEIDGNPAPDGTVLFNSDGSYSYDPAGDQDLDDTETREITFRYVANDGSEDSAEAEVTITVNGANDAPVSGGDDSASGSEDDASITGQVPVATDVDVEPLTYALVAGSVEIDGNPAPDGTVLFNSDGSYSYDPAGDQDLDDTETREITFRYVANDGSEDSAEAEVTITVNGANDAPVSGGDDSASGSEDDASITGQVPVATDVDVEPLTYALVAGSVEIDGNPAPDGTVLFNSDGSYSYDPAGDQDLDDTETREITFRYVANDGSEDSAEAEVTITVNGANDAPVSGGDDSASGSEDDASITGQVPVATDVDVEPLTYALVAGSVEIDGNPAPDGTVLFNSDGSYSYDPAGDQDLDDTETREITFRYVANDGSEDSAEAEVTITVNGANDAPVSGGDDSASGSEDDASITGQVPVATDVDVEPLTYALVAGSVEIDGNPAPDGTVLFNSDGSYSYDPAGDQDLDDTETREITFRYVANDGSEDSAEAEVTITVNGANDAPVSGGDDSASGSEDDASITGQVPVATDVDVEPLTYALVAGSVEIDGNPAPDGTVLFNSDGSYSYDPAGDQDLDDTETREITFRYVANDGSEDSAEAEVTITVNGANDAPVSGGDDSASGSEDDASITGQVPVATDVDVEPLTYALVAGSVEIDGNPAPDGTVLFNSDGSYSYDPAGDQDLDDTETREITFRYVANDGSEDSAEAEVTITVNGANDAPVSGGDDSASGSEDDASITGQVPVATDVDVEPLTYALVAGSVEIDGNPAPDGTVLFNSDGSYSYDPAGDQDLDDTETREITFRYVANDGSEDSAEAEVTITVNGANDAPVSGGDDSASGSEDDASITGQVPVATDVDVEPLTYALVAGSVEIDGNPAPDGTVLFNSDGSYSYDPAGDQDLDDTETREITFRYVANDGSEDSAEAEVTITVNGANDAPVSGGDDSASGSEDDASITGQVPVATDVDVEPLTYALVAGSVEIDGNPAPDGTVLFNSDGSYSYDPAGDQDLDDTETREITFRYVANDGSEDSAEAEVTITVNGANDAPVSGGDDSASGSEDDASITGQVPVATDVDVEPLTYALVAGSVEIDGNPAPDGTVLFNSDGSYSYDPAGDQDLDDTETREITFRYVANDGSEDSAEAEVTITVNGANDAPVSGGDDSASGSEDDASITGQVPVATDVDVEPLTYALVAGSVEIDGNPAPDGTVLFNSDGSYSYDPAGDQDLDDTETREITFRYVANDGSEDSAEAEVTITVNGANDAPVITSNGGNATASVNVAENSTAVTTVAATDVDVELVTFSISGGADAALFTINPNTGVLAFIAAPNFEAPTDAGANNVYNVEVTASDGTDVDTQSIAVTVTNVNEAPAITSNGSNATASINVAENSTAVTTVVATDPDAGTTITYSIVGGADQTLFSINSSTGALSFISAPNFEAPTDSGNDNVYDVVVQASDGSLVDAQAIAVTVTNVNAAPTITSNGGGATASVSVAENNTAVATVVATDDGENNATITYSIVGGADQALFSINSSTGALSFISAPNFEAPTDSGGNNIYDVVVEASDGSLVDTQALAVTVTNANEAPSITSNGAGATASVNVAENTASVTTVVATDPDTGTTITYSIVGGADAAKFAINSSTGALSFVSAPNFEAPTDSGNDNVYGVVVQASDGSLVDTQAIAVSVTNVNAAPTITSNGGNATASVSVAENTSTVTTVVATDDGENSGTITYSIVGGADAAKFTINSSTGALSFIAAQDFENPQDAGANNVYDVVVRASDGTLFDDQAIVVTVTNASEGENIFTNIAVTANIPIPEWALLYNDPASQIDIVNVGGAVSGTVTHSAGGNGTGTVTFNNNPVATGNFTYSTTDGVTPSGPLTANVVTVIGSLISGTTGHDILISTGGGTSLVGDAGNDVLLGGNGNDTYVFGLNDGSDLINDSGSGQDAISIVTASPLNSTSIGTFNFERVSSDLVIDVGSTRVTVRDHYGTGTVESISFTNGGTIFGYQLNTTSYLISDDGSSPLVENGNNPDVIASSSGSETLTSQGGNDLMFGNSGVDIINAGNGNDLLVGGGDNDTLNGENNDDTLIGGTGADTLSGGSGSDTFVLTDTASSDTITDYAAGETIDVTSLITTPGGSLNGFVRLTAGGQLQVDTNGGGDGFVTVATLTAGVNVEVRYSTGSGTNTVTVVSGAPPIALDLDGDGAISFLGTEAGATFDYGGGTVATAWVAGNDGLLVRDGNHDAQVSADEIVFATSGSDLEGLARYDSNADGQLSDADEGFAEFGVWQDADSDGQVDAGELQSLVAHSIASISLSSDGVGYSAAAGDVSVVGTGSFTRTDGSTGVLADAVFATGGRVSDEARMVAASGSNAALVAAAAVAVAGLSAMPAAAHQVEFAPLDGSTVGHTGFQVAPHMVDYGLSAMSLGTWDSGVEAAAVMRPADMHQAASMFETNHSLIGSEWAEPVQLAALPHASEATVPAAPLAAPPMVALPSAAMLVAAMGSADPANVGVGAFADMLQGGSEAQAIDDLLDAALPQHGGVAIDAVMANVSVAESPSFAAMGIQQVMLDHMLVAQIDAAQAV